MSAPPDGPILAVDLGGRRIKVGVVQGGEVIGLRVLDVEAENGLAAHLGAIEDAVAEVGRDAGVSPEACAGLGVVSPGLVDPDAGRLLSTNRKYPDAVDFDFPAWSRDTFGLTVHLENDAHATLLGEWRHGAASGAADVVLLVIGTGIGCSVHPGRTAPPRPRQPGRAARRPPHRPGRRSPVHVPRHAAAPRPRHRPGRCRPWPGRTRRSRPAPSPARCVIDYRAVFRHADDGDDLAVRLRDRSYAVWNALAVSLVHSFAPQRIVLGGGVMHGAGDLPGIMAHHLRDHAWTGYGDVEVATAHHPDSAALLGVATAIIEDLPYL